MAFELKEGEGYLNRDNENPEKFWGSFKVSKDMKKGDTINLTVSYSTTPFNYGINYIR